MIVCFQLAPLAFSPLFLFEGADVDA